MRYLLLAFLCLATVIAYVQRSALGVPSKAIESELGLSPQGMALVWLGWYAAYAVFQLPSGWIADRLGSKSALALFVVVWSVFTGVVGLSTGFAGLLIFWTLMGAAQAGMFPCATKAVGASFRRTEQAFASGWLACCMAFGAALAQEVTGRLLGPFTWHQILVLYAVPGLFWAVAFVVCVPRPDPPHRAVATAHVSSPPVRWSRLVTDPQMILLCTQQFLRAGATALFFTWFPRYLQETKGLSPSESGSLAKWPLLAGMLGGLFGGVVSDWLLWRTGRARLSRQGLAAAAMVVSAGASFVAYFTADVETSVVLFSAAAFWGYVGGVSAYAVAIAMGGTRVATVFATMNMAGNVGAALFPYAVGLLVALTGDWNLAILLFAGMYTGSGLCWVFLNPKGTLFDEEPT